ncbi:fructose-bisphosphate aldolase, class I [Nematocida major]|uniref:fructose-bisphosphate aldolase, class I n=1 Tax=Nematocida major TaxID=1912982 RepID=UPI0020080669|nr:fructose-bisphosphate aldolase, class I [Nematocida major]KAH9385908.1 fructose-bisphosphate aldolase, class I [Nematocida major]
MEDAQKHKRALKEAADKLVEGNKGILAIDESPSSMEKKFAPLGISNTEENRRRYRELLLTPPREISSCLSGVILNEETFQQKDKTGKLFVQHILDRGICAGVKLDKGLLPLNDSEKTSTGLSDLAERCVKYKNLGASFAKWRSVFTIQSGLPTEECIFKNCEILSEYALVCQNNGLVPVIEPEVLFSGSYSAETCEVVTSSVISCLFYHVNRKAVYVPGLIIKTGFVTAGSEGQQQGIAEVACGTLRALMDSVPPSVPGIVFLSGGHPEDVSVEYLKEASRVRKEKKAPWKISYSFGRALQDSVLAEWKNEDEMQESAQAMLLKRAKLCSDAVQGDK